MAQSLYEKLEEVRRKCIEEDRRIDEAIASRFRLTKKDVRTALDELNRR